MHQEPQQKDHEIVNRSIETLNHELSKIRESLSAHLEQGEHALGAAREQAISQVKATDRAIRGNPYPAIGIAFGVGILLTLLVKRK